jgi:hypothetical protein
VKEVDDYPLTSYEWNDWLDEMEEFNIKRLTPRTSKSFYAIILHDALLLFDMDDWNAATVPAWNKPIR